MATQDPVPSPGSPFSDHRYTKCPPGTRPVCISIELHNIWQQLEQSHSLAE